MSARGKGSRIVGVLSLLVIGAVVGIAADRVLHSPGDGIIADHVQEMRETLHARALGELHERLRLTDDQRHAIDRVFREHQATVDETWETLRPHIESVVDSVHTEILGLLDAEQREAFREWIATQAPEGMGARHMPARHD